MTATVPTPASDTSSARHDEASAARRYLEVLFGGLPGCIDLRLIEPDGLCQRIPCASINDTLKRGCAAAQTVNVYVGIATRRTMSRAKDAGGKENLSASRALWVDFDFKAEGDRERFEEALRAFPMRESMIVFSGGGMHAYWLLEEPFDLAAEADVLRFEHTLKGLCDHFGADRSATDASRILRVPGTVNYPDARKRAYGRVPTPCETLSAAGHLYTFDDFADFEMRGEALAGNGQRVTYSAQPFDGVLPARVELLLRDARIRARFERDATGLSDHTPSSIDFALASMLARRAVDGGEIETTLRISRARDATARPKRDAYFTRTVEKALATEKALAAVRDDHAASADDTRPEPPPTLTDAGNARRFVAQHGATVRCVHPQRVWHVWDGRRWAEDKTGEVERLAKATARALYTEAASEPDADRRAALSRHALKSESRDRLRAIVDLAETEPEMVISAETMDADPWLFNVENTTINLRTGELREHNPADYISKLAPVEYVPDAYHPTLAKFVDRILPDPELQAFVARALGYSTTGDVTEEVLFFAYGGKWAGKTTLLEAFGAMLGDYAMTADFESFLMKKYGDGPRPDLARLRGARFVKSVEVGAGRRLAEGLVKMITGGDGVTARELYEKEFTFTRSFKLWLAANDEPRVREDDAALWRRILQVPFAVSIPAAEVDPTIKAALRHDPACRSALLAWAMAGLVDWKRTGLRPPAAVTAATEGYRERQDHVRRFVDERCELADSFTVSAKSLLGAYREFTKEARLPVLDTAKFTSRLEAMGTRHQGREWHGIRLADG